jgi:hypothetical protein
MLARVSSRSNISASENRLQRFTSFLLVPGDRGGISGFNGERRTLRVIATADQVILTIACSS